MPGTDLNLDLPSLSDPMSTIVSKLTIALSAIEDDLEPAITPGQININSALSMNGAALTNVGSVQLASGNAPTTPGSFYYADGEFHAVDSTSDVRITLNGAIDASSVGGISGMGGTDAAVTYDLASTQFRFTSDTGVWADLVARKLILESASGSVAFAVDNAITTARQFNVKSLPSSGVSLLAYDASGSALVDNDVTRATNDLKVTNVDASGNVAVTGNITLSGGFIHPDMKYTVPTHNGSATGTTCTATIYGLTFATRFTTGATWRQHIPLRVGQRVKAITLHCTTYNIAGASGTPAQPKLELWKYTSALALTVVQSQAFSAVGTATLTISSPAAAASDDIWFVAINFGQTSPDVANTSSADATINNIQVTIDAVS